MRNEELQKADSSGRSFVRCTIIGNLHQHWISLDRGWKAICIASGLVLVLMMGVSIPW